MSAVSPSSPSYTPQLQGTVSTAWVNSFCNTGLMSSRELFSSEMPENPTDIHAKNALAAYGFPYPQEECKASSQSTSQHQQMESVRLRTEQVRDSALSVAHASTTIHASPLTWAEKFCGVGSTASREPLSPGMVSHARGEQARVLEAYGAPYHQ